MTDQTIQPGQSVTVCTMRGQWKAIIQQVSTSRYGIWGWFEVGDCENPKLNGAVFDLMLYEHYGKTAHFNCTKEPISVKGDLLHHYNAWALMG